MKRSLVIFRVLVLTLVPMVFSCVSTMPAAEPTSAPVPATLAAAQIAPPAIRAELATGTVFTSEFQGDVNDVYVEVAVEDGTLYDIFVVDGYNNGANEGMKLDGPAKAVGYWICKADAKASYPESVYKVTDSDSKGGYGFIGFTLEGIPGPVATVKAEGKTLFVHMQRYKASYTGKFMVKVVKK